MVEAGDARSALPDVPTVFIVDDDASLCRALARLIDSAGWHAETFNSAQDFLHRAPFAGAGCLLLDVQMPGTSGPELQSRLGELGASLPVVFLTAHGDLPTGIKAMKDGAVDFLQKPVDGELLLRTLRQAIGRQMSGQRERRQSAEVDVRIDRLSGREREVLKHVIDGCLNKQIADKMGISLKTVKVHRGHVMEKMGVKSVAALVHLCELSSISGGPCPFQTGPETGCARRVCLQSGSRCPTGTVPSG